MNFGLTPKKCWSSVWFLSLSNLGLGSALGLEQKTVDFIGVEKLKKNRFWILGILGIINSGLEKVTVSIYASKGLES